MKDKLKQQQNLLQKLNDLLEFMKPYPEDYIQLQKELRFCKIKTEMNIIVAKRWEKNND